MSDSGGQITNLGVLYQGKVAALYLGRMLDPRYGDDLPTQKVVEVRSEKPGAEVDDIYVRFADQHCLFIQAKIALQDSGKPWEKLWEHFYNQHRREDFGKDNRLVLLMGDYADWYKDLKTISKKASSSTSLEEWQERLESKAHNKLANKLALLLRKIVWEQEERKDLPMDELDPADYQRLKALLSCVDVRFIEIEAIESDQLIYWMPESNRNRQSLFSELFDMVVNYASEGRKIELDELRTYLKDRGVEIKPLDQQSKLLPALPDQDELPEAQEDLPSGSHLPFLRNFAFTGRVLDLQGIAAALFYHPPGASRRVALIGGGGSGKTQLADEFCYRYGRFTHSVHWLDATQSLESQIAVCGEAMKLPGWENLTQPEQVQRTLEALEAQPERLVVLDNLEEPPQLGSWLEVLKSHPSLITSRRDDYEAETGVNIRPVQTLPRSDSRLLLRKLARRLEDVRDNVLDKLCDRLGDLPLALDLAGRYLAREGIDIPDYLDELEEVDNLLENEAFISEELNRTTAHVRSLAATFRYSWKDLKAEQESDLLARRVFLACSYCAANIPIPANLLLATLRLEGNAGERKLKRSLNRLYRLGLLAEGERGAMIHPLLAEFGHSQDRSDQTGVLPDLAQALNNLASQANTSSFPIRAAPYRPHLDPVATALEAYDPLLAGSLWRNLGYHLRATGDYKRARQYYEKTLAINRASLGDKHPAMVDSLNDLGFLLKDMGDYPAARPCFEEALATRRAVLGEKNMDTAASLDNLGLLLKDTGQYQAARSNFEKSLEIKQELHGNRHLDTVSSLDNLGFLLKDMGDYPAARPYFEQALAIRREVLGEKHPDTATSWSNLGYLLKAMDDFAAARLAFEKALSIRREVLDEVHPDIATSLNNLGYVLKDMGDNVAARPYFEQALAIRQEVLGEKHPATATSLDNLGFIYKDMQDYPAARDLFEQSLAIRREVLGERHPDTTTSLNNLGYLFKDMDDYSAAQSRFEEALAIRREVLGEKHADTATSLDNLGYLLKDIGDLPAARTHFEEALRIRQEVLGENHPQTATSLDNLGFLWQDLGNFPAARSPFEQALAIRRQVHGEQHPATAQSLDNLGALLQVMGDDAGARPYLEQALAIRQKTQVK